MLVPDPLPALLAALPPAAAQAGQGAEAVCQPNAQVVVFKAKECTLQRQPRITHHRPEAPLPHQAAFEIQHAEAGDALATAPEEATAEQGKAGANGKQHGSAIHRREPMALLLQQRSQGGQASRLPSRQKIEVGLLRHRLTGSDGEQFNLNPAPATTLRQHQGIALVSMATQTTWIERNDSQRALSSCHARPTARDSAARD